MTPVKSYDVRRGSIQSWNGSDDSARQSRWVPKVIKPRPSKFLCPVVGRNFVVLSYAHTPGLWKELRWSRLYNFWNPP